MALSDADTIALARALWPAVTVDAASDAFLLSRLPGARRRLSEVALGADYDDAVAHLLAHYAYRLDPAGVIGSGGATAGTVTSMSTGKLSMSLQVEASRGGWEGELARTAPGLELLTILAPHHMPIMVQL